MIQLILLKGAILDNTVRYISRKRKFVQKQAIKLWLLKRFDMKCIKGILPRIIPIFDHRSAFRVFIIFMTWTTDLFAYRKFLKTSGATYTDYSSI